MSWLPSDYQTPDNTLLLPRYEEVAFHVYHHYLSHIVNFVHSNYRSTDAYIDFLSSVTRRVQGDKSLNLDIIKRYLFIGWNTEVLVRINDNIPDLEFTRVNNQWKLVQVYYSVYSLAEAACYAVNSQEEGGHTKCLSSITTIVSRFNVQPWNYYFTGYKGNRSTPGTLTPHNFFEGIVIPNPLQRRGVNSPEVIACCLRAEHRNRIDEWKRTDNTAPFKYKYSPSPTSLFHFLYRLRLKSNYKDAEIFLTRAQPEVIREFSLNLTQLNIFLNILLEVIIARKIGKRNLLELMSDFCALHNDQSIAVIKTRGNYYKNLIR